MKLIVIIFLYALALAGCGAPEDDLELGQDEQALITQVSNTSEGPD